MGLNVGPGFLFFGGGGGGVFSPRDFLRSPFLPHSIITVSRFSNIPVLYRHSATKA